MTQRQVAFNELATKIYDALVEADITSEPFPDFVRNAFYAKADKLKRQNGKIVMQNNDNKDSASA